MAMLDSMVWALRRPYSEFVVDDLSDEAVVAMDRRGVGPIRGRADGPVWFGDQPIVASARPSSEVHLVSRIGDHLVTGRRRLVRSPRCGHSEH